MNPSNDVVALEGVERGEPGSGVLVALCLVEAVGDGNQLGLGEVVGELLAASGSPITGSADPGFLQRNEMVLEVHVSRDNVFKIWGAQVTYDVEIGSQGGGDVVVG